VGLSDDRRGKFVRTLAGIIIQGLSARVSAAPSFLQLAFESHTGSTNPNESIARITIDAGFAAKNENRGVTSHVDKMSIRNPCSLAKTIDIQLTSYAYMFPLGKVIFSWRFETELFAVCLLERNDPSMTGRESNAEV
jgi:hypothetical protein